MDGTAVFNGTNGTVYLTTDDEELQIGSLQTFSLHQTNQVEDIDEAEFLGKKKRVVGYELTGTLTKFKVDHAILDIMQEYKDGNTPDIYFTAKAYNPNTSRVEMLKVIGVTFNEADIMNLEQKTTTKEEIPFAAEDYKWIALV